MRSPEKWARIARVSPVAGVAMVLSLGLMAQPAFANVGLKQVSTDIYKNTTSYHKTEVEPDTFSYGNTIVSAFQVGRFPDGGASNVGWATHTIGGKWKHGFLPGTTIYSVPKGTYARDTDPAVGYDVTHHVWMIVTLVLDASTVGAAVLVSRSTNGTKWNKPVVAALATGAEDFDKTWIACDNSSTAFIGHCYIEYDDFGNLDQPHVTTSTDGGLTWTEATLPASVDTGGQPLIQPTTGFVIMPIENGLGASIDSFTSHDGGVTFAGPFVISALNTAVVPGGMRAPDLPGAAVDGLGRVYAVWYDCTFEPSCASGPSANDIVMSTSLDGQSWTPERALPINPVGGGPITSFLPGIDADPTTQGASAALAVVYYYFPNFACSPCQLFVGYIASADGGATWGTPVQLAGPINPSGLAQTSQGAMVGDYNSISFINHKAYSVFAVGKSSTCALGQLTSCKENMYSNNTGLGVAGGVRPARTDVLYQGGPARVGSALLAPAR